MGLLLCHGLLCVVVHWGKSALGGPVVLVEGLGVGLRFLQVFVVAVVVVVVLWLVV